MAQSQIRSLDDEELEVLMDLRYRATVCTRRRTRLHQETRFIDVGHQVPLGLSGQELDPVSFYGVLGSMLRRMEALDEEFISRMAEEEQDPETFERVWGGAGI
ncbi:hypothetical protein N7527_004245 [Penicillium freii]|uniref:Uncharacterized protein n=1 Tax=Penicillium freii TaxID=48697 RepID=A0A117NSF7_PENFR|nr:hypothetical protein N7527_004245 [Penicillium freii]KUM66578.1 hypothetical protein ACN42_g485 [Penicillium freii]